MIIFRIGTCPIDELFTAAGVPRFLRENMILAPRAVTKGVAARPLVRNRDVLIAGIHHTYPRRYFLEPYPQKT